MYAVSAEKSLPPYSAQSVFYESGEGFLCEDCAHTHACDECMQLRVCNSPRMGVCGYEGSEMYPDQFVPDVQTT